MKYKILIILCFFALNVLSQKTEKISRHDIPSLVINQFKTYYPKAEDVIWYKTDDGYLSKFKVKGIRNKAEFDNYGNMKAVSFKTTKIKKGDVPKEIIKVFEKKNKRISSVKWYKKEGNYVARFVASTGRYRGKDTKAEYAPNGTLVSNSYILEDDVLKPQTISYIKQNYKGFRIKEIEYIEMYDKTKQYLVVIYKKKGKEMKDITHLYFGYTGKFEDAIIPAEEEVEGEEYVDKKHNDFEKDFDNEVDGGEYEYEVVDHKISKKELPTKALSYIKNKFNHLYTMKTCMVKNDDDLGIIYFVVMKEQGLDTLYEHYFDIKGHLIKAEVIE